MASRHSEMREILARHNFNGKAAEVELGSYMAKHRYCQSQVNSVPFWLGMGIFSGYQMTRFSVLSGTGRLGAVIGLPMGFLVAYTNSNSFERFFPSPVENITPETTQE